MNRIWKTLMAGTAAALFVLSAASAQSGANPQGATPQGTPQNTPAPSPQDTQGAQGAQGAQGSAGTAKPVGEEEFFLANQIAEQWLALLDQGKFADSWTYASKYFQANMPQDKWVQVLTSAQQQLGKATNRKMTGREARENIPGAPAGQYILIGYATDFEKKPGLLETLTFISEDDTWKVVGYSASPKPAEGAQGQGAQGQGQGQGQNPAATDTPQPTPPPPPSR